MHHLEQKMEQEQKLNNSIINIKERSYDRSFCLTNLVLCDNIIKEMVNKPCCVVEIVERNTFYEIVTYLDDR